MSFAWSSDSYDISRSAERNSSVADATRFDFALLPWVETHGYIQAAATRRGIPPESLGMQNEKSKVKNRGRSQSSHTFWALF